jgi:flap endonuclease-1
MGIKQLMTLINDKAPGCVKSTDMSFLTGKVVAIDASMSMYQFIAATQMWQDKAGGVKILTDDNGNETAHLIGIFNRTIMFLEHGVKPVWVFDGKPPELK